MTEPLKRAKYKDLNPKMLAEEAKKFQWVMLKYDGHYSRFDIDGTFWKLTSRTGKTKCEGQEMMLPNVMSNMSMLGEHLWGTQWSNTSERKGKFVPFGIPGWEGSFEEMMVEVYSRSRELGAILPLDGRRFKAIEVPKFWPAKQAPELWEEYIVKYGWEGLVFIKEDGSLGRCKKLLSMDYVVLDVATSDSDSYAGQARALIGGLYQKGVLVKKVSICGLTEFQRGDFMRRKKELIGQVFEAEGRELFTSGALRHPNFIRFRDDKLPQECVWPRG